jgi:transcriptional regulator with XRE-family HTH domain
MNRDSLAALLAKRMKELRISENRLARRSGVSRSAIGDILRPPHRRPRLDTLSALAAALDTPVAYFAGDVSVAPDTPAETAAALFTDLPESLVAAARIYDLSFDEVAALCAVSKALAAVCPGVRPTPTPKAWLVLLRTLALTFPRPVPRNVTAPRPTTRLRDTADSLTPRRGGH